MCGTPGPNNIMLTASGVNFGFRRSIPHILGVVLGMIILFSSAAFGLGVLFELVPFLHSILKILGSIYLLYLAYRILISGRSGAKDSQNRPLSFIEAAAFQFVNPKGLMITITTMSTFTLVGEYYWLSVLVILGIFASVSTCTMSLWTLFGTIIGSYLKNDSVFKFFNFGMATLLVLSVIYILK